MRRVRGTEMAAAKITEPAIDRNIILGVLTSTRKQKLKIMMKNIFSIRLGYTLPVSI
jgi:hypothetical protein